MNGLGNLFPRSLLMQAVVCAPASLRMLAQDHAYCKTTAATKLSERITFLRPLFFSTIDRRPILLKACSRGFGDSKRAIVLLNLKLNRPFPLVRETIQGREPWKRRHL